MSKFFNFFQNFFISSGLICLIFIFTTKSQTLFCHFLLHSHLSRNEHYWCFLLRNYRFRRHKLFLGLHQFSWLNKPFNSFLIIKSISNNTTLIIPILSLIQLLLIFEGILHLQLLHLLNLIQINHKTFLIPMLILNAFSTKYCLMERTIKVLHSFLMLKTQLLF